MKLGVLALGLIVRCKPGVTTTYTVTGSNTVGSVTAQVTIEVNVAVIGEWLPADYMNQARYRHTATLLSDGQVLVAAGFGKNVLSSAELFDPVTDSWSQTGNLSQARMFHTATRLPTGRALVAGGIGGTQLSSAELYDPAAGTWTPLASARLSCPGRRQAVAHAARSGS
ncbi:hypothetical protein FVF58_29640 [Paraburkholderia panacisoli]|uniref:Kelch motif protein n=1 Tax=Paraburkholderia panacisoli TaxID=2603818 RepID=A0A5B0GR63_9BURK|nr:kelch repeat-containing protein [Paraburkholderia panacisoli]KAA1005377.1 hypothetical protein FVF58_29640 [Paraburkholderia panacisoli]